MTVVESLQTESVRIREMLCDLCSRSLIRRWHNPLEDGFIYLGGHFRWEPLDSVGIQLQTKILQSYRRFSAILNNLLLHHAENIRSDFKQADDCVIAFIERQDSLFDSDKDRYLKVAIEALDVEIALLNGLYGEPDQPSIFVPDTNALIHNPDLDQWRFDDAPRFQILLIPPVLNELDKLKVGYRVEAVRDKAMKVIRQIKEYRRRAAKEGKRLSEGATLASGISEIAAVANEPRMASSLPWLDPDNMDDRILAATVEVMRMRPKSSVSLVTSDINLQNKAENCNITFIEPPDPT